MSSGKAEKAVKGIRDLLLGRIASRILTFGFLIAFVRLLSMEELAIIPLYFAASGAATLLFSFGIPVTLVREVPRLRTENPGKMRALLFTGFSLVLAGIITTSALALAFGAPIQALFFPNLNSQSTYHLIIAGMIIGGWKSLMTFILKALQEYRDLAVYGAIYELLQRTFGLIGYLIYGIDGLLAGFLTAGLICNLSYTRKVSGFIFSTRKILPLWGILRFSWPFYIEGYLYYFRNTGDIWIISAILGPSALGAFYVAKRLYELFMMTTRSIMDVVAPSLAQLLGESLDAAIKGYERIALLVPITLIPVGALAAGLSYSFVEIVGGSEYTEQASFTAAVFCWVAVVEAIVGVRVRAIFVLGKPADRLKIVILQVVIYFPLVFLLTNELGIVGAPIAQAAASMLAFLYAKQLMPKAVAYQSNTGLFWKTLGAALAGLIILIALQLSYYSPVVVPLYAAVSVISMLLAASMLSTQSDLERIETALPARLKNGFDKYVKLRNRFF